MRDLAEEAKKVIYSLEETNKKGKKQIRLTTTQLRKFLTAVTSISNKVSVYKVKHPGETKLSDELAGEIQFLKVKAAYQAGRESAVKKFMENADMFHQINSIGNSIEKYEEFSRYIEALVAYRKFYGGDK